MKRVKKSRDLADWWIIGEALQVLQEQAMNAAGIPPGSNHPPTGAAYNAAMAKLLEQNNLADIDKADRSRILKMMENRAAVETWHRGLPLKKRLRLNHPSTIMRYWTKFNEQPEGHSATALQKTETALAEAYEEIDRLKAYVAELEACTRYLAKPCRQ